MSKLRSAVPPISAPRQAPVTAPAPKKAVAKPKQATRMTYAAMNAKPLSAKSELAALDRRIEDLVVDEGSAPSPSLSLWNPGQPAQVGRQYLVGLEHVEESANNARAVYSVRSVSQVTESIQELGQLQAAMAWCRDGKAMVLTEGHTRARAIKRAGQKLLRVEVVSKPADDFMDYRMSREVNIKRRNLSYFDDAVRFTERLAKGQTSQSELARRLDLAEDYVSKVLKIGRLPALLLERMAGVEEPSIGLAAAYVVTQFYELQGMAAAEKLVGRIVEERISVRRLEQMLAQARASAKGEAAPSGGRRLRPMSRTEVTGAAKGELKAFPDGRIELQLREVPENLRETLYLRFLKLFEDAGLGVTGLVRPPRK